MAQSIKIAAVMLAVITVLLFLGRWADSGSSGEWAPLGMLFLVPWLALIGAVLGVIWRVVDVRMRRDRPGLSPRRPARGLILSAIFWAILVAALGTLILGWGIHRPDLESILLFAVGAGVVMGLVVGLVGVGIGRIFRGRRVPRQNPGH
jgi:uncharacterized membrane protein YbhN (UPF0104 family)